METTGYHLIVYGLSPYLILAIRLARSGNKANPLSGCVYLTTVGCRSRFRITIYILFIKVAALTAKKNTSVRWHPLFIRWCLSIMLSSPKTYDIIRDSEFISLPCRRTLCDYTNWVKAEPGFQPEITSLLLKEAKVDALSDSKR